MEVPELFRALSVVAFTSSAAELPGLHWYHTFYKSLHHCNMMACEISQIRTMESRIHLVRIVQFQTICRPLRLVRTTWQKRVVFKIEILRAYHYPQGIAQIPCTIHWSTLRFSKVSEMGPVHAKQPRPGESGVTNGVPPDVNASFGATNIQAAFWIRNENMFNIIKEHQQNNSQNHSALNTCKSSGRMNCSNFRHGKTSCINIESMHVIDHVLYDIR